MEARARGKLEIRIESDDAMNPLTPNKARAFAGMILAGLCILLSSCAPAGPEAGSAQGHSFLQKLADLDAKPEGGGGYALRAGDKIKITVFGDTDLTGEYDIDSRGYVTMPLIGDVRADGLTADALQKDIAAKLANGFIVKPRVSIQAVTLRPFYISGEVRTPGSYPAAPSLDAFQAVALAGGLTPRAVRNRYVITRGEGAGKRIVRADDHTPVYPGDSIYVKERFF
jgi:polysaccharide export outer membrane protein